MTNQVHVRATLLTCTAASTTQAPNAKPTKTALGPADGRTLGTSLDPAGTRRWAVYSHEPNTSILLQNASINYNL